MNRKKDKGRIGGPFVPLLKETLACPAWKALGPSSRLVYVALKGRYGIEIKNNGRVYLSVRMAMEETGLSFNTIRRGFLELQHYGFIVMTRGGFLGLDGHGKATHWRLTELGYMSDPPTKDYLRWDGVIFESRKNRIPTQPVSHH
jgi:DeoR-like helix-turn-helix domain